MNKKDIADIRRHFKMDADLLKIHEIYNVYIRKETSEIYHEEARPFPLLDPEQQELFLANFKKVLGGKLDVKLFEVKFTHPKKERRVIRNSSFMKDCMRKSRRTGSSRCRRWR